MKEVDDLMNSIERSSILLSLHVRQTIDKQLYRIVQAVRSVNMI